MATQINDAEKKNHQEEARRDTDNQDHQQKICFPKEDVGELMYNIDQGDVLYIKSWLQDYQWNGQAISYLAFVSQDYFHYGHVCETAREGGAYVSCSLLHIAISCNQPACVKALLQHDGVNVEILSMGCKRELQTPLQFACQSGANPEIVQALLDAGANVRVRAKDGTQVSVLILCAECDSVETARVLLAHDASLLNERSGPHRQTALIRAIMFRSYGVRDFLLECGADPNITDQYGSSALHMEIERSSISPNLVTSVSQLLERGANVEMRAPNGSTPLMLAVMKPMSLETEPVFLAILQVLLDAGASTVVEDMNGVMPLHCARTEMVIRALLQDDNLSIDLTNSRGETALHAACRYVSSSTQTSILLRKFCASRHLQERVHGRTPLHYAARLGHFGSILLLLEDDTERCMMARCTTFGRTPLHDLVCSGLSTQGERPWILEQYLSVAERSNLLDRVIHARDKRGWTALHFASFGGYSDAVRTLIEAGADVRSTDNLGRTPLHIASLTLITAKEWNDHVDIPRHILAKDRPMSPDDWNFLRSVDSWKHVGSFRGCGPPGGFFITSDVPKILLKEGRANPLVVDNDGNLPLFFAALLMESHPELLSTVYLNVRAGAHMRLSS